MVTQFNLEKNIEFKGNLERSKIMELMRRSKIFIHPSRYESFGYVFAEALVNGMTIISRRTGAAFECEKWFIAENDDDFCNLVSRLLSDKINYNSFNPFTLEKTVKAYREIYE
jgi:glycosyltransferase involved in cell wall biosynthesis